MVLLLIGAAITSAIFAGTATYFATRPGETEGSGNTSGGAVAEIRNDVNIQDNKAVAITSIAVSLLTIIVIIKIIELVIYVINRCKKSIKKKYESRTTTTNE